MSKETMTDALRERIAKAGPDDPVGTLADMERFALHVADAREARLRGEAQAEHHGDSALPPLPEPRITEYDDIDPACGKAGQEVGNG